MQIKNLGPIKDASINLNELNIFIGKNGTGKTVAAYAIYSFVYWFSNVFEVALFDMNDVKRFIHGDSFIVSREHLLENISKNAVNQFNNLDNKYFIEFFNNEGIYGKNSKITITPEDVESLVLPAERRQGWFYSWPYVGEDEPNQSNSMSVSNSNDVYNEILSTYNHESDAIETRAFVVGHGGKLDKAGQDAQINSFEEEGHRSHVNNLSIVNLSLKNVLFSFSPVYLPAERIGINVFRSDLNISRLNRSNNVSAEHNGEYSPKRYPLPIEDYISYVNNKLINRRGGFTNKIFQGNPNAKKMVKELVPGKFEYHRDIDAVKYKLPNSEGEIDFELLSSSLKSIFGVDLFIKYNDRGDWIFIDEPEMNLHPSNQVVVANLMYQFLKFDIRSVISTHSDYFIKKFINNVLQDRVNNFNFSKKINVYDFGVNGVRKLNYIFDVDEGIDNFDDTTNKINAEYYDLLEKLNEEQ